MKKILYFIIPVVLILLFILYRYNTKNIYQIKKITIDEIDTVIREKSSGILYTKDITYDVIETLNYIYDEYKLSGFYSSLSEEDINSIIKKDGFKYDGENGYFIIYVSNFAVDIIPSSTSRDDLKIILDKYLFNVIPENEQYYQVLSTANEYIRKVNSDEYTVAVFGDESCSYCGLYLPVINEIAKNYKLSIYYFDESNYEPQEYTKIMNLDFEIPAKCTTTGNSTSLTRSFPKPMTIITKKGEFVDCIRGYVSEETVLEKLSEYKIVKGK